jgi:hypothetical protein
MIVAGFDEPVESASIRCGGCWAGDMALVPVWRGKYCTLLFLDIEARREDRTLLLKSEVKCG